MRSSAPSNPGLPYNEVVVVGTGTIAAGLAAVASKVVPSVQVVGRSSTSASEAQDATRHNCRRVDGARFQNISFDTRPREADGSLIIEAIVEDFATKVLTLESLRDTFPNSDFASTTSSLSISNLAEASGLRSRFVGLHVFNPVPVMKLVEVCFPPDLDPAISTRILALCEAVGKTAIRVPDRPGFAVNRLLFPYLFDAVRFGAETGMSPEDLDVCMSLGAAHPLGPLALLDLIGLDVAAAIGAALFAESQNPAHQAPASLLTLVELGHLGRKSGRGFHSYRRENGLSNQRELEHGA